MAGAKRVVAAAATDAAGAAGAGAGAAPKDKPGMPPAAALPKARSSVVDVVEKAGFSGCASGQSQFVYESSTGYLYYDSDPSRLGFTGVLARLTPSSSDPAQRLYIL